LPLMLYGVPVWIGAMAKKCNKILYTRVQSLMNIKIAKAYRTTSSEALSVLTGITPIQIKVAETDRLYHITRDRQNLQLDHEEEPKDWTHPADSVRISEQGQEKEHMIHIYTDGSKNEHGVGSGSAIYIQNKLIRQLRHKLHDRCSHNQAEQMAIVKALQEIETIQINKNILKTILIHTDSMITLDSLKNMKNRNYLIEAIRKKTIELEKENWHREYTWINPLNPELNPICYLLALLAHHFLHVSRIMAKSLTLRLLMSYIYGAHILDVSRSHTTTQHSR